MTKLQSLVGDCSPLLQNPHRGSGGLREAQGLDGIKGDLTLLGKIIGGGLPVGADGGKRAIMEKIVSLGGLYQARTLSGNPLAMMTAGMVTLELLKSNSDRAEENGIPITINRGTGMFTVFFTAGPVRDYRTAKTSDTKRFAQFFIEMMEEGIYLSPSQFEAWFISLAHTQKDLDQTIEACDTAFKKL